jgi:hypothetical protein
LKPVQFSAGKLSPISLSLDIAFIDYLVYRCSIDHQLKGNDCVNALLNGLDRFVNNGTKLFTLGHRPSVCQLPIKTLSLPVKLLVESIGLSPKQRPSAPNRHPCRDGRRKDDRNCPCP